MGDLDVSSMAGKGSAGSAALESVDPADHESGLIRRQVVEALRRAIELGTLKAGDRLIEKNLCERLGVSRTSLREAFRDLEAQGVVRKVAARTLIITPLTAQDVVNITRVRAALEMMLAETFCKLATPEQIAALERAAIRLLEVAGDEGAHLDANREFYRSWCRGAGNDFLFEILMNVQLRLSVVRSAGLKVPQLRALNIAYHQRTVERMTAGDVAGAIDNVRQHNRDAAQALLDINAESLAGRSERRRPRA